MYIYHLAFSRRQTAAPHRTVVPALVPPHTKSPALRSRPRPELQAGSLAPHASRDPRPRPSHQADLGRPDASELHRASSLGEKSPNSMKRNIVQCSWVRPRDLVSPEMCLEPSAWSGHSHARGGGAVGGREPPAFADPPALLSLTRAWALGLDVFPPEGAQGEV